MAPSKRSSRAASKREPELFDAVAVPQSPGREPSTDTHQPRAKRGSRQVAEPTDPTDPYAEVGELFPGASARSAVTVSTLTQSARDVVEGAFFPLWVRG